MLHLLLLRSITKQCFSFDEVLFQTETCILRDKHPTLLAITKRLRKTRPEVWGAYLAKYNAATLTANTMLSACMTTVFVQMLTASYADDICFMIVPSPDTNMQS